MVLGPNDNKNETASRVILKLFSRDQNYCNKYRCYQSNQGATSLLITIRRFGIAFQVSLIKGSKINSRVRLSSKGLL